MMRLLGRIEGDGHGGKDVQGWRDGMGWDGMEAKRDGEGMKKRTGMK